MNFVHSLILLCTTVYESLSKNVLPQAQNEYTMRHSGVESIYPSNFYKKYKNKKRHIKNHLHNFINRKIYLNWEKKNGNNKVLLNKMSFIHKRNKITTHLGPIRLGDAKQNSDFFLDPNGRKQNERKEDKNILSSLYSKMVEKSKYKNSILNDVSKLYKVIRESKNIFAVGLVLTIISSVVDSYIPIFLSKTISYVMNRSTTIVEKRNIPIMNSFLNYFKFNNPFYVYAFTSLLSLLFSSLRSYMFNICAYVSTNKLQVYLFSVLLHKHISYFKKKGKGELISRLNIDSSELIDIFTTNIIVLLRNVIKTLLSFYFLYKINVHLFLVSLFIVLVISNISIFFSSIFRKVAKEESNVIAHSNNIIEESIDNFSLISTFNTHNKELAKFNSSLDGIYMCRMKLGLLYIIEKLLIRLIDMITLVLTLILSKQTLKNNIHTDSRIVISSVMYIQNIISQSCTIEQQYSRVQELIGNAEDIIKLIEKDTLCNNYNRLMSHKYPSINLLNFVDLKNAICKYSLIKKFQSIQKNADYVSSIIKPNYLKLFERNYNNLHKFFGDDKNILKVDQAGFPYYGEAKTVEHFSYGSDSQKENKYNVIQNKDNKYVMGGTNQHIVPNDKKTKKDAIAKLNEEIQLVVPSITTADNNFNKCEKGLNKLKKNKLEMNIQEIYYYIKNDDELIIKHKLDKKFVHFLRTKYKKYIIMLILKLYEERHNFVSDDFLFMLDNISSFKKLSIQDKKSILRMSNITNNTLYVILLTFLFYNYSKFYYKREKKTPVNLLEKKSKTGMDTSSIDFTYNTTGSENDIDHATLDGINMNEVLSCVTITDMYSVDTQGRSSNESSTINEDNTVVNENNRKAIDDSQNFAEIDFSKRIENNGEKVTNLWKPEHRDINEEEILKNKKLPKKKKKNLTHILPYIVQNAIKELEILKYIDENYKHINENLILDNVKDDKKGSRLIFENVDFYYAKYPKNKILSNINLNFSNKYTYGILCYNDSGKDDISKLCARLYNKTYGNILLDNENIENVSKYILTRKISLVEEDTYLFSNSIIYNILYSYNCKTKANKYFSYFNYNFGFNRNSINICVHLFPSDNDLLEENGERVEPIKRDEEKSKGANSQTENELMYTSDEANQTNYTANHFKKCLMCGNYVNTKQIDEQKKKKRSYNRYKAHFIKKLYKEIIKVSKIVCIDDLISSYKDKFFHNISEKTLSGGQKQKISLARAIIKKPKILILNEAFNALDSANELKIFSSIKSYLPYCTIINLSHKITTIDRCDYIYVLKDGKIIEHGLRTKLKKNPNSEYSKKMSEF
ncbi:ATP-dependent transporter [Plasmodium gonderi]|uniref:ATP-dependent transporter n=1 Tax=Plasmodium gonderi TaxID=77519 RepID=A0A1Y1JJ07_PLAGO|nr:ATP-dependent transporter [Plasmodium gonderi]GAW80792.1 ATP-dependent transporter [Plasmodium gonderi]